MAVVLGIDAAWTATEPSGVALVASEGTAWRCLAVAPSYESFIALAERGTIGWEQHPIRRASANIGSVLATAEEIAGRRPDVVTVDMPVATVPFSARRKADDEISLEFGSRWCSAHTPNAQRPGAIGRGLSCAFREAGYPIAVKGNASLDRCLVEVYPHPALLSLLKRPRRVPYKVAKSAKYWPDHSVQQRIEALLSEFTQIADALTLYFGAIDVPLPRARDVRRLSWLKRYEDALDGLVCTWVGAEYLGGRTVALGDETAAIWCPSDVVLDDTRRAG